MAAQVITLPQAQRSQGRIDRNNRFRIPNRFGDLTGSSLTATLNDLDNGKIEKFSDLVDFALDDSTLQSLYTTRIDRVAQADYIVVPNERGNPQLAQLAAEFCDEAIDLVENWDNAFRMFLHAIALGFSASEENWRVSPKGRSFVNRIDYRPGNLFRYGPQWDLRYYNRGQNSGADTYGDILWPEKWIVHSHVEKAGNPSKYGLMRSSLWRWLFLRWGDKSHILYLEKHGHPTTKMRVGPNTPTAVRNQMLSDLENMSYDHVYVYEEGELEVTESNGTGSTVHTDYLTNQRGELSKLWLGTSDAVEPGSSGNQAAVSTRAGVALDPRMVRDGKSVCDTIRKSFFRHSINKNLHLFGAGLDLGDVPLPRMRLKTADDEVVRDQSDKQEELQDEAASEGRDPIEVSSQPADEGATPTPGGSPKPPPVDKGPESQLSMFADPKALPRKGLSPLELALRGKL